MFIPYTLRNKGVSGFTNTHLEPPKGFLENVMVLPCDFTAVCHDSITKKIPRKSN
jgi:hypothetical protein